MSPETYKALIAKLGLTQEAAGLAFGVSARTGQRWAVDGPPKVVAMLLLAIRDKRDLAKLSARYSSSSS